MEAKDTVMSDDRLVQVAVDLCDTDMVHTIVNVDINHDRALAKTQAEITWDKAIREVVKWVRSNAIFKYDNDREAWQAKLKEWRIK
ncbi:hypothetical protein ES704_01952 [subsurface metagenome]|jgi:folylpolyglutamate synthase/dihydropteroate synthase